MRLSLLSLVTLISGLAGPAFGQAPTDAATSSNDAPTPAAVYVLRYQFSPNQVLRYETHQQTVITAQVADETKVDRSELKQRRRFTAQSIELSQTAKFAMQFEHVWMQMQSGDRDPISFDSSMKPDEIPVVFRSAAHQLRGTAPKFWLSDRGLSVHPQSMRDDSRVTTAAASSTTTSSEPIQLVDGVKLSTGSSKPASGSSDPGSFLAPLPDVPVRAGDTWTENTVVKVRLTEDISREIPILQTFRLDRVEQGLATISFWSSIEAPALTTMVRAQLIQATPKGTLTVDLNRGLLTRRELTYDSSVPGAFGPESLLTCTGSSVEMLLE